MSRETALRVLTSCRTHGAWADAALQAQVRRDGLDRKDAALCSRIVYGVLQNHLLLDFYLGAYCTQRLDHLQPPLADILRIGAYQILFLDKVPDSAAVNSSVELAKLSKRGQAAGLVNAVLRKISQNKEHLPPIPEGDTAKYLSIRYSHPRWLVKRLLALLGREETEALLALNNQPAPITAQVNTCRYEAQAVRENLLAAGVEAETDPALPDCLYLSGSGDLERLELFRAGAFYIQDPASRLAVLALDPQPGGKVLDVCAAPGGKSFAAAIAMEDRGEVWSCDLHPHKKTLIQKGAQRLGLTCIQAKTADGKVFLPQWEEAFERVLVDAPCSGLGVIRKKPDIRFKDPAPLAGLPQVQGAILDNAARYVKPGGVLVYSTCTILDRENGGVTDAFRAAHPEFCREGFTLPGPAGEVPGGQITLWPQIHGTDGFFICRLRRDGEAV